MIEHDGCVGCKFEDKEDYELPCKNCKGTKTFGTEERESASDLYISIDEATKPISDNDRIIQLEEQNKVLQERLHRLNLERQSNDALLNNLLKLLSNPYLTISNVSEG